MRNTFAACLAAACCALLVAGCAASVAVTGPTPDGGYLMSAQEQALDCRKLRGSMQIRILQVRDADVRRQTTMIGRTMQTVSTPVFGGTGFGADPVLQRRQDLAMLAAYNDALKAKGCETIDYEAQIRAPAETPGPQARPKS